MSLNDVIDRVIKRIRMGWTRGWYARDLLGNTCRSTSPKAVCWCVSGAFAVEGLDSHWDKFTKRARIVTGSYGIQLNDKCTSVDELITALETCKN